MQITKKRNNQSSKEKQIKKDTNNKLKESPSKEVNKRDKQGII